MSMLAEKRQKKSWILNPRSTTWSCDTNKFGHKMLEKMGWTPGKGLGVNEQGMVDILRVKIKNDFKGLGCDKKVEDWIKTQEDFNNLLGELGANDEDQKVGKQSLEERSKSIKSRVHYHKFARGKDLSRYSSNDLKCILGVNTDDLKNIIEEVHDLDNKYENFERRGIITSGNELSENKEEEDVGVLDQSNRKRKKKKNKSKAFNMKAENDICEKSNSDENFETVSTSKKRKKKKKDENQLSK